MPSFSYKPAPLLRPQNWTLQGSMLVRRGDVGTFDLKRTHSARYVTHARRGRTVEYLQLEGAGGRTRIQISHGGAPMEKDRNFATYVALVSGILLVLEEKLPELLIATSASPLVRYTIFGMGLAGFLLGCALLTAVLLTGLPANRIMASGPVFLTLMAFGAVVALINWPQKPVYLSPSQLQAVLTA